MNNETGSNSYSYVYNFFVSKKKKMFAGNLSMSSSWPNRNNYIAWADKRLSPQESMQSTLPELFFFFILKASLLLLFSNLLDYDSQKQKTLVLTGLPKDIFSHFNDHCHPHLFKALISLSYHSGFLPLGKSHVDHREDCLNSCR